MERFSISPEIDRMLVHFYRISGLRVGIHDLNTDIIVDYPRQKPQFEQRTLCEKLRFCSGSVQHKCNQCDKHAFEVALTTKKTHIYECYMGHLEAVIPIISGGEVLCFLMIGQVRQENTGETDFAKTITDFYNENGISEEKYPIPDVLDDYRRMPCMTYEKFTSFVYFLEICAQKIYNDSYIWQNQRSISEDFIRYIKANLYDNITVQDAATALNLSSSYLSHVLARDMGTSFTRYLNVCRIEEAKRLLGATDMTAKKIALLLRYGDTAYFVKQFKKVTGKTCTEYRNAKKAQKKTIPAKGTEKSGEGGDG